MEIPDHLTCLLRNLYAGQEATVRTRHGTTDWFQIGKGVCQGCILSPCLFNFYSEYSMRNAGMDEAQVGIKIAGRKISATSDMQMITLMAEAEEELYTPWNSPGQNTRMGSHSFFQGIFSTQGMNPGLPAEVQPRLIQGIRRTDGVGDLFKY